MSDYGRYGDTSYAQRDRDRDGRSMFGQGRLGGEGRWAERGSSRSSAYDREGRSGRNWDRDEAYYGYDDYHRGLPIDETSRLIASNKVEGTPVYGKGGDRLGGDVEHRQHRQHRRGRRERSRPRRPVEELNRGGGRRRAPAPPV